MPKLEPISVGGPDTKFICLACLLIVFHLYSAAKPFWSVELSKENTNSLLHLSQRHRHWIFDLHVTFTRKLTNFLRMSIVQISSCNPSICLRHNSISLRLPTKPCILPIRAKHVLRNPLVATCKASVQQRCMTVLKNNRCRVASTSQHSLPVCLLGGKGKNGSDNEGSPWKSLEKAMGTLKKESSIEDVLRQQIEKNEFYEDKDSGTRGGGSGGGGNSGGGGGGADPSGGSEDEGFAGIIDETLQVILATIGFIFLYVYIIDGEEWTRLAKDYLKYLFSGSESVRLRRAMYKWGRFYQKLTEKKVYDKYWLEKAIISTPTWWDSPAKYRYIHESIRSHLESDSDE
ncbi:hypothetical protein ACLB2K_040603 [Fragaria x ananassa]